jgi:hypothetical protein
VGEEVRPHIIDVPLALTGRAIERAIHWLLRRARNTSAEHEGQNARLPR